MSDAAAASAKNINLVDALRKTGTTALLALGLFLPLIGFEAVQNIRNELILQTRWPLLFALVAVLARLRFIQLTVISPWLAARAGAPPSRHHAAATAIVAKYGKRTAIGFV